MSLNYIRKLRITPDGGSALDLSEFQVEFLIKQATVSTPNIAEIRFINLSDATVEALRKRDLKITVEAGYEGNFGAIFRGTVKQGNKGRATPTETYLDLFCGEGDQAYIRARVAKTLPAGSTRQDIVNECLRAFGQYGIGKGFMSSKLAGMRHPRPYVMFGLARDHMSKIAKDINAEWSFQGNKLQVLGKTEALPGGDVVMSSETGMIGRATQTFSGIQLRSLINPRLLPGSVIKIDEKSIDRAAPVLNVGGYENPQNARVPSIAADGRYKIFGLNRVGSVRGNEWYDHIYCLAASGEGYNPRPVMGFVE